MLYLNNIPASSVGVLVEHRPARPIPRRKTLSWDVPGRSGKLYKELEGWDNVALEYSLAVVPPPGVTLGDAVDKAVAWLTQGGDMRLYDDTDPSVFYLVRYYGGASLAPILHRARRATISFDADPRRFLIVGDEPVYLAAGESVTLANPTGLTALPLIRISSAAASARPGTLTVGAASLSFADGRSLTIDSDKRSSSAAVTASGNLWPKLPAGETNVSLTGAGLTAEIFPRWFAV